MATIPTFLKHLPAFLVPKFRKEPTLTSSIDLANAIAEISAIDARIKVVEARRQVEHDKINQQCAEQLQIEVDGELVPAETYRAALIAAIETYLPQAKGEVFTEGTQTVRFPCGEISWKTRPATVSLEEGVKAADVAKSIATRKRLTEQLHELLEQTGLMGTLRLKYELDLAGLQRRFRDGLLKKRDLPKGLTVVPSGESFSIKPLTSPDRADV